LNEHLFFTCGDTSALNYALAHLKHAGCRFAESADDSVTHLILPVPSFEPDGTIKGGGNLSDLIKKVTKSTVIIGGNLSCPELDEFRKIDLLKDEHYLAQNAALTAHCAVKIAMNQMKITFSGCPVLIIGWGRIGKCLADLLRKLGSDVSIAARKESARAMISALGYDAVDTAGIDTSGYKVICNTVPAMVCPQYSNQGLVIDLASKKGINGLAVIWARGLPSKEVPESSGYLIAETILRLLFGKEQYT